MYLAACVITLCMYSSVLMQIPRVWTMEVAGDCFDWTFDIHKLEIPDRKMYRIAVLGCSHCRGVSGLGCKLSKTCVYIDIDIQTHREREIHIYIYI